MDHIDTCLMTTTLEFGIQPCIHNCFCSLTAYNSGTESNDICVVMFFYETGCYRLGTYCRTYPFYFVCSDGDTDTGSTDQHTTVRFTCWASCQVSGSTMASWVFSKISQSDGSFFTRLSR